MRKLAAFVLVVFVSAACMGCTVRLAMDADASMFQIWDRPGAAKSPAPTTTISKTTVNTQQTYPAAVPVK